MMTQTRPGLTRLTRRSFLGAAVGTAAVGVAGLGTLAIIGPRLDDLTVSRSVTAAVMETTLHIPPLATSQSTLGRQRFDLTLQAGETEFFAGERTPTWGINGSYLGPTLVVHRGEEVEMVVDNQLDAATTLHWHGMHLPAEMDGTPHQMIEPGSVWQPSWRIENPASTLWYHPHPHGETARHTWNGLAGMIIVQDDEDLSLPSEYGVDDIPVIIQDRSFGADGDFDRSNSGALGTFGNTILVNGTPGARFTTTRSQLRLRLLNGSNARWYNLQFNDRRSFALVATDAGFLFDGPQRMESLVLSPGERAEIVVEIRPEDDITLRSEPSEYSGSHEFGTDESFDVLRLIAAPDMQPSAAVHFPSRTGRPSMEDLPVRTFALKGHTQINGLKMDMTRVDEVVPAGSTEIWEVHSSGTAAHNFHIHGCSFEVLSVGDRDPDADHAGPKDTVRIPKNGEVVRLLVTFPAFMDPDTPYMFHCHILRHEDRGMMGQFLLVEPGTESETDRVLEDHHHEKTVDG